MVLVHGSESWALRKDDETDVLVLERTVIRTVYRA
jgi:hypothetical protein